MISRLSLLPRLLIVFVVCVCCGACELDCADTAPTTVRVPPVQIAFGIMIYQKSGRSVASVLYDFHNLMEVIYTAHNHLYVLHVDVKSDPALIGSIYDDFCKTKPNCITIMSRNVAWAGLTTGEMMLALMQTAHEAGGTGNSHAYGDQFEADPLYRHIQENPIPGHNWTSFVLIGHESVPLVSLPYVESFLASHPANTNFMNCMPVGGYDFFGQWEDASSRLSEFHVDSFGGELVDVGWVSESLVEDTARGYREQCGDRLDGYSPPVQRPFHRQPPTDIAFFKSIQLMVSSEYFRSTVTCSSTLHFTHWIRPGGSWHPEYLTLEHLPILLSTHKTHLFVRKLDSGVESSRRLAAVLHRVRTQYLSTFHPTDRNVSVLEKLLQLNNGSASDDIIASMPCHRWLVVVTAQYICETVVMGLDTPPEVLTELDLSYLNASRVPVHEAAQLGRRGQLVNPSDMTPLSSTTAVQWSSYCRTDYKNVSYDWQDKSYMSYDVDISGMEFDGPSENTDPDIAPFEGQTITATDTLTALHIIRMARDGVDIAWQQRYWRERFEQERLEREARERQQ